MGEHNIPVLHTALESLEGIHRVERRGGLLNGMHRKICHEIKIQRREQVETALSWTIFTKPKGFRQGTSRSPKCLKSNGHS